LMLLVVKRLLHMKNVEFIWLQKLTYKLCPWVVFPLKKGFVENILTLNLVKKTMMLLCLAYIG
jgi:hypothetical protein